jgi:hypothetical protein
MAFETLLKRLGKIKGNQKALRLNDDQTRTLQRQLNAFTNRFLEDITPLRVDGEYGPATKKRVKFVKYYLGWNIRTSGVSEILLRQLNHPRWAVWSNPARLKRAVQRRARQRKLAIESRNNWRNKHGYAVFDGKNVPEWMVHWLKESRAHGWRGVVVSGVRTAAYSEHLCFAMCGAPSCPGRCAGRNSNHNMEQSEGYPEGALDVSDYTRFGQVQHEIGSPLHNALGVRDPVHFSVSGR